MLRQKRLHQSLAFCFAARRPQMNAAVRQHPTAANHWERKRLEGECKQQDGQPAVSRLAIPARTLAGLWDPPTGYQGRWKTVWPAEFTMLQVYPLLTVTRHWLPCPPVPVLYMA